MLWLIETRTPAEALTSLGVSAAFTLTMIAVFMHFWKKKNVVQTIVSLLALVSCGIFLFYSWVMISPDLTERFVYASPLLIGLVVGAVLNQIEGACDHHRAGLRGFCFEAAYLIQLGLPKFETVVRLGFRIHR